MTSKRLFSAHTRTTQYSFHLSYGLCHAAVDYLVDYFVVCLYMYYSYCYYGDDVSKFLSHLYHHVLRYSVFYHYAIVADDPRKPA